MKRNNLGEDSVDGDSLFKKISGQDGKNNKRSQSEKTIFGYSLTYSLGDFYIIQKGMKIRFDDKI